MRLAMGWVLGVCLCALGAVTSCGGRAQVDGTDGVRSSSSGAAGGGSSASGGGTGAEGGSRASSPECAAMDARSSGDDCLSMHGYAWNGANCEAILCGCVGSDCDATFATADDCDHAYRECFEAKQVSRACQKHSDCMLQARTCCPVCIPLAGSRAGDMLIATSATSASLRDAGNCIGPDPQAACGACTPFEPIAAYAACIAGECRLLDVTANAACTMPADCRLSTRDCCDCGGDFSDSGVIAVSGTARHSYCAPDLGCPECEGGEPSGRAQATCDTERSLCRVGFIPK